MKFYAMLKVTFHLQWLQNIGCIPGVVQYIFGPILYPTVCASYSPTPKLSLLSPNWEPLVCSLCESASFLLYSLVCCIFWILGVSDIIQYLPFSLWLTAISIIPSKSIHVAANGNILFFLWLSSVPSGHYQLDTAEWLHFHFALSHIGEGNGSPLQCSCLENPRDGGAWLAAIYGVAQS